MRITTQNRFTSMGSYPVDDVTFLLKDLSEVMIEKGTEDREEAIQSGVHYSEMLPIEYQPSPEYMNLYHQSLNEYSSKLAVAVGVVAEQIAESKGEQVVLVSLARAGTPIGILIKRYLSFALGISVPHYSVSIIRGRGIDTNAISFIKNQHPEGKIQFVDGWTGKGAITRELNSSCKQIKDEYGFDIDEKLAVLADPGYCAHIYGTREDFLIPSACLNSTVSGLISRTVLNKDYIQEGDFHGAKYYSHLENEDVSNDFIDRIVSEFPKVTQIIQDKLSCVKQSYSLPKWTGLDNVKKIQKEFGIENVNMIKPGVGETTRVLLRRVPWKILVKDKNDERLKHIILLAEDRGVPIVEYQNMSYACCGLIKTIRR
ncbi:hypothetical protein D0469_11160 [Peribacillus saganii]|uniref:Uncharacterized protein n=1 Tax=Peribacillus saganii TaxID=2303992 RepID=A0A372LPK0_9BACI|nr:cysteine protease StiP family protein [Peribacillus saganii]RFU69027.1 hypothetical protein D0469_11160 [Peribacillus saganii]